MKLSKMILDLQLTLQERGDITVQVQEAYSAPVPGVDGTYEGIATHENFFIIPESYEDGWRVNIRTWPY